MLGTVAGLSAGGLIGFLLGLLAVWWVQPPNEGGTGLIIGIAMVICILFERGISQVRKFRKRKS